MIDSGPDSRLLRLESITSAANAEIENYVAFREIVRPAWENREVAHRLNLTVWLAPAAIVLRQACQREMLMALSRLWDDHVDARLCLAIGEKLGDHTIQDALRYRLIQRGSGKAAAHGLVEHSAQRIAGLVAGASADRKALRVLRNERLAHRDTRAATRFEGRHDIGLDSVDRLFRRSFVIASRANHLVHGTSMIADFRRVIRWRRKEGEAFWKLVSTAPRSPED